MRWSLILRRRPIPFFVTAILLAWVGVAGASTICVIVPNDSHPFAECVKGFTDHLTERNVKESLVLHTLAKEGTRAGDLKQLINGSDCKIILALGNQTAKWVSEQGFSLPIVLGMVFGEADIASVPRATGVYLDIAVENQLAVIHKVFPQVKKVGVVHSGENRKRIEEAKKIAPRFGLAIEAQEIASPKDIPDALEWVGRNADALWGLMDRMVLTPETAKHLLLFSLRNEMPFFGPSENWAKAGATAAFGWNYRDIGAQCGILISRVLSGERPEKIIPVPPREHNYSLNLRALEQIRVKVGPEAVGGAKQVFRGE